MKKVYAVGCLQIDTNENARTHIIRDHLCNLYAHFEEAEKAVLENYGDIFERYYNYALIEETYVVDSQDMPKPGEQFRTPAEWWYRADYSECNDEDNWYSPKITACPKPKVLEQVVYFFIG